MEANPAANEQTEANPAANEQAEANPAANEQAEANPAANEQTKVTTTSTIKDPKRVEAGRLSAISRAAKKRQRELLQQQEEEEEKPSHYDYKSSLLYFAVPSIFLAGMFLWSLNQKKKNVVVVVSPKKEIPKKPAKFVSLFD